MTARIKHIWQVIRRSVKEFADTDPMSHSAAIAFYTLFSMPAVLIMIISIAGTVFDQGSVRNKLFEEVEALAGPESAQRVQTIIENTGLAEPSTIANAISIGILLFSATTVFSIIQHSLNIAWRVMQKPEKSSIIKLLIDRGLSFLVVIILGTIMAAILLLDTALVVMNEYLSEFLSRYMPEQFNYIYERLPFLQWANYLLSTVVITFIFAVIYKILPDVQVKWRDVWAGALSATLLFLVGKYLIGLYLSNSPITSAYGAAGSLVVILIWVFYSAIIILYGASFTKTHADYFHRPHKPRNRAVEYVIQEVAKEEEKGMKAEA